MVDHITPTFDDQDEPFCNATCPECPLKNYGANILGAPCSPALRTQRDRSYVARDALEKKCSYVEARLNRKYRQYDVVVAERDVLMEWRKANSEDSRQKVVDDLKEKLDQVQQKLMEEIEKHTSVVEMCVEERILKDPARREVCDLKYVTADAIPADYAKERGWDCFKGK